MAFEVVIFYWVGFIVLTLVLCLLAVFLFWLVFIALKGSRVFWNLGSLLSFGKLSKEDRQLLEKLFKKFHKEKELRGGLK